MNLVISDPKTGNGYSKKLEDIGMFLNKKLGEEVELSSIGLEGYKAKITGGSDSEGFPMNPSISGTARKKVFLSQGIGFNSKMKGIRKRINVRGNTINQSTHQINLKLVHYGKKPLNEVLPKSEKQEKNETAREKLVRQSLESVGDIKAAEEAKKIKGKVRR
jgi:small subunit ribosomal protein S6e